MTTTVKLLYLFLAFCPLSEGIHFNCPFPFLNQNAHLSSEKLCATLQLQTKLPCPGMNLSVSENVRLNPAKWHLKSLSLKVEKTCSFMVFQQDKESQHFPGGFYSNINIIPINTQSEFVCICPKLHNRYRRDFSDFKTKHLVDSPESPCDTTSWKKMWDYSMNHRKKCAGKNKDFHEPKTQSFMKRHDFSDISKIFTRDPEFNINKISKNNLYRSKIKMDIYDVQLENGVPNVVHRCDYVVVALDNNDKPIHYEPITKDIAEQFPQETMPKNMETGETDAPKGLKAASMTTIGQLSDMIAIGEGTAMTAVGGCSMFEDDESVTRDGTTPVGGSFGSFD